MKTSLHVKTLKDEVLAMVHTLRTEGLKKAWMKYRWRFLMTVFLYYLIRDTFLYVILPLVIVQWL